MFIPLISFSQDSQNLILGLNTGMTKKEAIKEFKSNRGISIKKLHLEVIIGDTIIKIIHTTQMVNYQWLDLYLLEVA